MSPEEQLHSIWTVTNGIRQLPLFKTMLELRQATDSPRLLVIAAHGLVELAVNALIDLNCKNAKLITSRGRDFPHSVKLLILNELGILTDSRYKCLNWFRQLRNDAAHNVHFSPDLSQLSNSLNQATKGIGPTTPYAFSDFHDLCVKLALSAIADHEAQLMPVLANLESIPIEDRSVVENGVLRIATTVKLEE